MPKRKSTLRKAWHTAAGPFVRVVEVAKGERLSRRKQAKLDKAELKSDPNTFIMHSGSIPLNRRGRETGMRFTEQASHTPKYRTVKETRRGKITRSFLPDGTLKKEKRTTERRSKRLGEGLLVETTKEKRVKRGRR